MEERKPGRKQESSSAPVVLGKGKTEGNSAAASLDQYRPNQHWIVTKRKQTGNPRNTWEDKIR